MIFLIILFIFAAIDSEDFRSSKTFTALEYVVVVAVAIAIGLEFISIIWNSIS